MCHPFSRPTLERLFSGIQFGVDDWGERELSQLAAGSVIKVLQKGMGHGSHWGVIANPVKRKARA
jgi:hypothetical protein